MCARTYMRAHTYIHVCVYCLNRKYIEGEKALDPVSNPSHKVISVSLLLFLESNLNKPFVFCVLQSIQADKKYIWASTYRSSVFQCCCPVFMFHFKKKKKKKLCYSTRTGRMRKMILEKQ